MTATQKGTSLLMTDSVTAAQGYALCRGWMIFPVPPGTKQSYKSAKYSGGRAWGMTRHPMEIERDFRRWPEAGVGIPTGKVNSIFVVEADTVEGHGVDGLAGLKALEARHGRLPETLTAESPSGSIHRYFNWPGEKIKNSDGKLAPGVDVKGDGGMVVAPPTRTEKGVYRWLNNSPVADAPGWLVKLALRHRHRFYSLNWLRRPARSASRPNRKPVSDKQLRAVMAMIPNDDATDWEDWNRIGLASFAATNGSDFGFELFDEWSQKNEDKYDYAYTYEKWEKFKASPPTDIGVGTLIHEANYAEFRAEAAAWERLVNSRRR
jgi:hypothetical protein